MKPRTTKSGEFRKLLRGKLEDGTLEPESDRLIAKEQPSSIGLTMVPAGTTDEQKAISAASAQVETLLRNPAYALVYTAMVTFRRCYRVAYGELQDLLAKEENVEGMTEDLLVGAVLCSDQEEFSEHELVQGLTRTVLPWMGAVIDRHTGEDVQIYLEDQKTAEEERRNQPIPLGFDPDGPLHQTAHGEDSDGAFLDRSRPLVLVGWGPALRWLMERLVTALEAVGQLTMLRLHDQPPPAPASRNLGRISHARWRGCTNTQTTFAKFAVEAVNPLISAPLDLLVCDNLGDAYTAGYVGRPAPANAGDANKRLAKWCKDNGAALIGLVPIDDIDVPIDIRTPAFEQLRAFTSVRSVHLVEHESVYSMAIGAGSTIEIPKTEIKVPSTLIL